MSATPSRKQLTHDRIVETAARAIRRAGYAGTGVADIMKEAGLTHGGFYAHFDSREAMVAEAIEHAGKQSAEAIMQRVAANTGPGVSAFRALVEAYLSDKHLASTESGCPVAALLSDTPRQGELVRKASCARVQGVVKLVASLLPPGAAPHSALAIAGSLVGTLQLARAFGATQQGKAFLAAGREALLAQYDQQPIHKH